MIAVAMTRRASSTTAALLKNQAKSWSAFRCSSGTSGESTSVQTASLCLRAAVSLDDLYDARIVASKLGFPFYVVNLEDAFERESFGRLFRTTERGSNRVRARVQHHSSSSTAG